jgi:hypothetical protein
VFIIARVDRRCWPPESSLPPLPTCPRHLRHIPSPPPPTLERPLTFRVTAIPALHSIFLPCFCSGDAGKDLPFPGVHVSSFMDIGGAHSFTVPVVSCSPLTLHPCGCAHVGAARDAVCRCGQGRAGGTSRCRGHHKDEQPGLASAESAIGSPGEVFGGEGATGESPIDRCRGRSTYRGKKTINK